MTQLIDRFNAWFNFKNMSCRWPSCIGGRAWTNTYVDERQIQGDSFLPRRIFWTLKVTFKLNKRLDDMKELLQLSMLMDEEFKRIIFDLGRWLDVVDNNKNSFSKALGQILLNKGSIWSNENNYNIHKSLWCPVGWMEKFENE